MKEKKCLVCGRKIPTRDITVIIEASGSTKQYTCKGCNKTVREIIPRNEAEEILKEFWNQQ